MRFIARSFGDDFGESRGRLVEILLALWEKNNTRFNQSSRFLVLSFFGDQNLCYKVVSFCFEESSVCPSETAFQLLY